MTDPYEAAARALSRRIYGDDWSDLREDIQRKHLDRAKEVVDAYLAASPDLYRKCDGTNPECRNGDTHLSHDVRVVEEPFDAADVVWDTVNVEHVTEIRFYETVGEEPE